MFELDDGHKVGVSVGGRGVPLVFLHGLALNRRAYLGMLSRAADLGFLVIAIDAAGHGDTQDLPRCAGQLSDRVALTLRVLDALGIERAVFAGHSMGARMAIQLAAVAPERVLAAVLINAAAGSTFDETLAALTHSPRKAARAILGMRHDTHLGAVRLPVADVSRYLQMLASAAMRNARRPIGPARAALAIAQSGDYTPLLQAMRDHRIPTMVLHGDSDVLVPFDNARDIAEHTGGSLYRLPGACHSWLIGNPRHGADALRQLLTGELGDIVNGRRRDGTAGHEAATELQAWIHRLAAERPEVVGVEQSERVEMELVDSSVELGVAI